MQRLKFKILICLMSLCTLCASAGVRVQAKLDSTYLLMGKMTTLHVTVTQPKDAKGTLQLLQSLRENGIIPVCGDSVEMRAPTAIDTLASGSNLTIKYEIPVQSFDSGYYKLPEIEFVVGNDTARSQSLGLKVVPVKAEADTPINDYASVAPPANPSIFDYLPDWVVDFWWILLILLLAIVLGIYLMRRYRRQGYIIPKKPEPTPYEKATAALRALREKKLWEQGMEKEYYTELIDILREYLEGRFGINAMEMTSRQILHALGDNKEISEHRPLIRRILDMADFVKFAKVRPLPEDNVRSFETARQFVEDTKPVEKPEEEQGAEAPSPKKGGEQ